MSSMNLGWVRQQPTFNTIATDDYPSTTTDYNGNVYVAYMTTGTTLGQTNTGGTDIVIVKLNSIGDVLWVKQQSAINYPTPNLYPSIASDTLGNLYIVFQIQPEKWFFQDRPYVIIVKLDQDGVFQWKMRSQQSNDNYPEFNFDPSVTIANDGSPYICYNVKYLYDYMTLVLNPADNPGDIQQLYDGDSAIAYFQGFNDFIYKVGMYVRSPSGASITVEVALYLGDDQSQYLGSTSTFDVSNISFNWFDKLLLINIVANQSYNVVITNISGGPDYIEVYATNVPPPSPYTLNMSLRLTVYKTVTRVLKLDTDGNQQWESNYQITDPQLTPSIAVDTSGNSYVAVNSYTNVVLYKLDSSGLLQWDLLTSDFDDGLVMTAPGLTVDAESNPYLVYQTDGTVSGQTNTGDNDIVVAKFDTSGNILWLRQQPTFNTIDNDQAPSIALNSSGNGVCIAYQTNGIASGQTSLGGTGIVVFQMDSSGNTQWVQQNPLFNAYGGGGSGSLQPSLAQVTVGDNNYIYVSYFTNGVTSGQTNTGGYDIVVFQLRQFKVYEPAITYGQDGYLYYAYYTSTSVNPFSYGYDVVVVKMDTDGNVIWSQQNDIFDTRFSDLNPSIVTYDSNVYVVYQTEGQVSGGFAMVPYDIVVMKMDGSGNIVWIQEQPTFNTTRSNEKPVIDVDSSGNLYVAYQTLGRISGGYKTSMIDRYDVAIFKMDPDANVLWTFQSEVYNNYRGCYNTKIRCDNLNQMICLACTCESNAEGQTFCGYSDILVLKVTYDGAIATTLTLQPWVFEQPTFDTFFPDDNSDVCLDGEGNIYLCYCTNGGTVSGQTATGFNDIVIVKFNSEGDVVMTKQNAIFNSSNDNINPSIAYHYGFIYVTLQTNGSVSGRSNVGSYDVVIMKINVVTFAVMWIQQGTSFDTPLGEASPSITTDPDGNCYVAYQTDGSFPGPYGGSLYMYNGIVVTQLYTDGSFGWVSGQL